MRTAVATDTVTIMLDNKRKQVLEERRAAGSGICLRCGSKNLRAGKYDHVLRIRNGAG
jgi:hypothetical protein